MSRAEARRLVGLRAAQDMREQGILLTTELVMAIQSELDLSEQQVENITPVIAAGLFRMTVKTAERIYDMRAEVQTLEDADEEEMIQ